MDNGASGVINLMLPHSLYYPITITSLSKQPGDQIEKFNKLLEYKFQTAVWEDDDFGNPEKVMKWFIGTWESPLAGELKQWYAKVGDVIQGPGFDIVQIEEPCAHAVQFGGLCAICGLDLTKYVVYPNYKG